MRRGWQACLGILVIGWMAVSPRARAAGTTPPHSQSKPARPPAPLRLGRERALVFSPHPDDATLGAGGLIQHVIRTGGTLRVVQVTGGDAFPRGVRMIRRHTSMTPVDYRWYGSIREREAIRAMRRLGVSRAHVSLLGFPDEGLCTLASTHRVGTAFESPYTKRDAPPASEQLVPGTMYRGQDLVRELADLIAAFRPTLIVLPHSGDQHPDHCATHLLVHDALAEAESHGLRPPRVLHYVVHFPGFPSAQEPEIAIPPDAGVARGWRWRTLPLTASEEAGKLAAIDTFHSQMVVMSAFLHSFVRANELFVEGEQPLPIPCWCGGEDIATPAHTAPTHTVH